MNGMIIQRPAKRLRAGWPVLLSAVALCGAHAAAGALEAGNFPLRVNDVSGLDEPWPLIGGLPFPEGALHDAAQIRVVDADGVETPAQIDVVARWRDGSIRWAQAGLTASPQGDFRVEFGPDVSRRAPANPLRIERDAAGGLSVDTGAAVYAFRPDRLLPDTARMGDTVFLTDAGDGAYLIDNQGRRARVAGEAAEIETRILKQGPMRTVIRREGWYVTDSGAQVARARVWFYLAAGSPALRITHSIVFTENTNDFWVRDYGLAFRTPESPEEAVFALSEATEADRFTSGRMTDEKRKMIADMFSIGLADRTQTLFTVAPGDDEVYMLQENYPHVVEREFRAVVARATRPETALDGKAGPASGNFWVHSWLKAMDVAGDWGEARCGDHALMVVMPQLAQRFPKEIAIGPDGARVAFWSGRSGRELDFRAVTLVNEYWKQWTHRADGVRAGFGGLQGAERGPQAGTALSRVPSNAQSAARTHEVWLLPRTGVMHDSPLKARALAAAHPPLLQADPRWLCDSQAIGWPMHPKDTERFPEVEAKISNFWEWTLADSNFGHRQLRRAGFIMWGKNVTLGHHHRWFRLSGGAAQYGFDRSAWLLYMRSGERRYYDYGRHFTRFSGDWMMHHWNAGDRFRGGRASAYTDLPFYWGNSSTLGGGFWTLGWMLEYYLTGDEYADELLQMRADAYREHADPSGRLAGASPHGHIYNLSILYQHTHDETLRKLLRQQAHMLIDLDNPLGLDDGMRYGVYYKTSTEWLFPLYLYYNATGDEVARTVILRALDDKYRFFYSSNQTVRLFNFAEAYRWTGNPAYLRLLNLMVDQPIFSWMGHNYYQGAPAALHAIANAAQPIEPFPVLAVTRCDVEDRRSGPRSVVKSSFWGVPMDHTFIEADTLPPLQLRKSADAPVNLSIFVSLCDTLDKSAEPEVGATLVGAEHGDAGVANIRVVKTQRFRTRVAGRWHPHRWHVELALPADLPAGEYAIMFPNAATIVVLESDAPELRLRDDEPWNTH